MGLQITWGTYRSFEICEMLHFLNNQLRMLLKKRFRPIVLILRVSPRFSYFLFFIFLSLLLKSRCSSVFLFHLFTYILQSKSKHEKKTQFVKDGPKSGQFWVPQLSNVNHDHHSQEKSEQKLVFCTSLQFNRRILLKQLYFDSYTIESNPHLTEATSFLHKVHSSQMMGSLIAWILVNRQICL